MKKLMFSKCNTTASKKKVCGKSHSLNTWIIQEEIKTLALWSLYWGTEADSNKNIVKK